MVEAKGGEEIHPEGLTEAQEVLSVQLFDIGAIKFGDFRMQLHEENPDAPLSPIYLELRMIRREPLVKNRAVDVYEELVRPLDFDLLADVPTAATPLVSSLSDRLNVGMITPRMDSKTHGSGAKIDGMLPEDTGKKVVLIDDLITRADSKLKAIEILEQNGLTVKDVVTLIDREQGGREQLRKADYDLHSAFTMRQMIDFYLQTGRITQNEYEDTLQRLKALNEFLRTI